MPLKVLSKNLTRKVFQKKDLLDGQSRHAVSNVSYDVAKPGSSGRPSVNRKILWCECARYDCALLVASVKVGCHKDGEFGCGKAVRAIGDHSCFFAKRAILPHSSQNRA